MTDTSDAQPRPAAEALTPDVVPPGAPAELPSLPSIVWLDAQAPSTDHPDYFGELLVRELVRQAVLLAAREGLQLTTRDSVLREAMPGDDSRDVARAIHVSTHGTAEGELQVTLWQGSDEQRVELWTKKIPLTTDPYEFYFPLVKAMEEASRGELAEALRKAGFDGAPNVVGQTPAGPELDALLAGGTFPSQFSAVREAHAQARLTGESPEVVGALVRGYAHLGMMTQHYWDPMCKVFQARSLLYAERLVAGEPKAAYPLWVRGYARAWAGLHAAALADFAEAGKRAETTAEMAPDWVRLAELHSRYDSVELLAMAKAGGQWKELAHLLAFMDHARGGGDANTIDAGELTIAAIPESYLTYDRLCDFGGVSYGHTSTLRGSAALAKYLPRRLAGLRGLPDDLKQQLPTAAGGNIFNLFGRGQAEEAFSDVPFRAAQALIKGGATTDDEGELSWAVLGRMIQEEDFVLAVRRALFLKAKLGVPVDDFVTAVLPNLEGHPYAPWFASLAIDKDNDPSTHRDALLQVNIGDLYSAQFPFLRDAYSIPLAKHETGAELVRRLTRGMDLIALDLETKLLWYGHDHQWVSSYTEGALKISPYSPRFIAARAEYAEADKAQLEAWEREFGRHLWVLKALSRRYLAQKDYADAERCLKRAIELSADQDNFEKLADAYQQQGDDDRWRSTLEECLKFPDYGLSHAWVQTRLARHDMEQRNYDRARPYAEAAAQTGAEWAMSCASDCLEALHEWDESGFWAENISLRYPDSRFHWYFWCRRTGQGDLPTAQRAAQELAADYSARNPPVKQDWVGIYHLLNGERKLAYDAFQAEYSQSQTYWAGLHVVLLADEFGETATRDRILNIFVKSGVPDQKSSTYPLAKFAVILQDAYQGGKDDLDLEALDVILDATSENQRMDIAYFAARYLAQHGHGEDGTRYLKRCYSSTEISQLNRTLAAAELLDAGNASDELMGPNE